MGFDESGFKLIAKYFWLLAVFTTFLNVMVYKFRAQKHIRKNPKLKPGYDKLFRGYMFWLNIPWLVMGVGCEWGNVPSVFHYFRPQDGNPYVQAWFVSIIVLWILGTYWLLFKRGAEILSEYPGAFVIYRRFKIEEITDPKIIRIIWFACLAGGIAGLLSVFNMDISLPDFLN